VSVAEAVGLLGEVSLLFSPLGRSRVRSDDIVARYCVMIRAHSQKFVRRDN
jgi:hypothetical protein